ncbi:MAG: CxxC-x17-CxxC domain-containing protein [Methanomethylovorans sp.]|uniref:CxxC-x17-CxxC domain-containing protein n=1 Tax=Methanomethylovorans sp. TaxID=2758717 RepID=UPI000A6233DD|nr:CxxC-x17-CxxC domain-containing protein [Methanomethylovorans sp.]
MDRRGSGPFQGNRGGGGRGGFNRENREMHNATCADCGKETQVPFVPDPNRPVYCRDCLPAHRPPKRY